MLTARGDRRVAAASAAHRGVVAQSELRYEGTGGLVLLHELVAPQKKKRDDVQIIAVIRKDPFAAPDQLREGIGAAFRDWPSTNASIAP